LVALVSSDDATMKFMQYYAAAQKIRNASKQGKVCVSSRELSHLLASCRLSNGSHAVRGFSLTDRNEDDDWKSRVAPSRRTLLLALDPVMSRISVVIPSMAFVFDTQARIALSPSRRARSCNYKKGYFQSTPSNQLSL